MKIRFKIALTAFGTLLTTALFLRAQTNPPVPAPRFAYGGDAAELAAQFTDSLVFLPARVNVSPPSLFILDTTAQSSSIGPERAAEIDRTNLSFPVLNLDGLDVPLPGLPAKSEPDFGPRTGLEYQGTLGRDFLSNLVLEIDFARQTVRAYAPASYKYTGKGTVFPLSEKNGIPVIPLRVALERGKERSLNFFVETALDAPVVFDNKFLAAHHMNGERGRTIAAVDPLTGESSATLGRLRAFQIGKNTIDDVLGIYSSQAFPTSDTPVAGAIGSRVLRRFTVVFDFPHHQLMLEPNSHFSDPDEEDKSGLLIVAKGMDLKTFEVANVQPNSPAAAAGIKKGDVIAGVDTDPAADLSLLVVRDLFRQVGHKYKITVQKGAETKEITLQMHRYF
ncbi:MAG TPA: PDZ domain-containing protein [Candidatus Acidoferrales bacterium]|nr:PDZ domain-containing protein [Candidatus Acidoferrales bacterium]